MPMSKAMRWRELLAGVLAGVFLGALEGSLGSLRVNPEDRFGLLAGEGLVGILVGAIAGGVLGLLASLIAVAFSHFHSHERKGMRPRVLLGIGISLLLLGLLFSMGYIGDVAMRQPRFGSFSVHFWIWWGNCVMVLLLTLCFGPLALTIPLWSLPVLAALWGLLWGSLWGVSLRISWPIGKHSEGETKG